jgi:heat shock protein HslJ
MFVVASIYGFQNAGKKTKDKAGSDYSVYKGVQTTEGKETIFVLFLMPDRTCLLLSKEKGDTVLTGMVGSFSWNKAKDEVTLESSEGKHKIVYKMNGTVLEKMKENKKAVAESERHQLQKIDFQEITDKYWKLVEIEGKKVAAIPTKESHIFLGKEDNRVNGSSDCNTFIGQYNIEETNKIKFSKIAASMKACLDSDDMEKTFFRMLQTVDNYSISRDGQYLSLNKAKKTLARFEVVYLK